MPESLAAHIGDLALLERQPLLGLLCSVRCPGEIILRLYDLAVALREEGVAVVGGFHAPMEREALALLLRGRQPVVVCPARGVGPAMRLPREWRAAVEQGRLLVISPFAAGQRRATAALAEQRNRYVAGLARAVFIAHAAPGGQIERLASELIAASKPPLTFASDYNASIIALGARGVQTAEAVDEIRAALAPGEGTRP